MFSSFFPVKTNLLNFKWIQREFFPFLNCFFLISNNLLGLLSRSQFDYIRSRLQIQLVNVEKKCSITMFHPFLYINYLNQAIWRATDTMYSE